MKVFKKYILWACLGAVLYVFLSYHFVIFGKVIKPLKKSKLTLEYTFFNVYGKSNARILSIDDLREDGIADLLMDMGVMGEKEYDRLMAKYEDDYE